MVCACTCATPSFKELLMHMCIDDLSSFTIMCFSKKFEKHVLVNDDRLSMCMSNYLEGVVHVHAHTIIFYACSAHAHCVKVLDWTRLSSWMRAETAVKSESAGGLMVKALGQKLRDLGSSPSQHSPFPASKIALEKIIY